VLQNLLNAWKSPELRKKLLFTAAILAIYRFGSYIPAPGVNSDALSEALKNQGGIFGLLSVFSGGGLSRLGVFALGIMP
jgi:preprotein translocase subunit SecY